MPEAWVSPKFSLDFLYSEYKGGVEVCTSPQDGCVLGELPFAIDVKGGENVVERGVMIAGGSTCVAINAKGGDC